MARQIVLHRVQGPGAATLLLDVDSGHAAPVDRMPDTPADGTYAAIAGELFALYVDDGALWLQWNGRRWPLATTPLQYGHDLDAGTTTFTVDGHAFTYPAWWRGDPTFEPLIPERDAHEDWLAYVMVVKAEPGLQAALLKDRG